MEQQGKMEDKKTSVDKDYYIGMEENELQDE
jgi:hypothetical protein